MKKTFYTVKPTIIPVINPSRLKEICSAHRVKSSGLTLGVMAEVSLVEATELISDLSGKKSFAQCDERRKLKIITLLNILVNYPDSPLQAAGHKLKSDTAASNILFEFKKSSDSDISLLYDSFVRKIYYRKKPVQSQCKELLKMCEVFKQLDLEKIDNPQVIIKTLFDEGITLAEYLKKKKILMTESDYCSTVDTNFRKTLWEKFTKLCESSTGSKLTYKPDFYFWVFRHCLVLDSTQDKNIFSSRFSIIMLKFFTKHEVLVRPFLEICKKVLGEPPSFEGYDAIPEALRDLYLERSGYLYYEYFKIIAKDFYQDVLNHDVKEGRRLKGRVHFWWNYRKSIKDITIFLPDNVFNNYSEEEEETLKSHLRQKVKQSDCDVPYCELFFSSGMIREYFTGIGKEFWTEVFSISGQRVYRITHNPLWQYETIQMLKYNLGVTADNPDNFRIFDSKHLEDFDSTWTQSKREMEAYYEKKKPDFPHAVSSC